VFTEKEKNTGWYKSVSLLSVEEAFGRFESSMEGLSGEEALARLARYGMNKMESDERSSAHIFVRQLKSPFVYLLFGAAAIAALAGEIIDAGMIGFFIAVNTMIGFYQEYHAEKTSRRLRKYWHGKTRVLRDGTWGTTEDSKLMPGDIVEIRAGDKIPADIRIVRAKNFFVDESVLTGESSAVAKNASPLFQEPSDYHEASNIGFAGTSAVMGEAIAMVCATGKHSSLGRLTALVAETKAETVFEKHISEFGSFVLKLVSLTLLFVFLLNLGFKGIGRIEELLIFSVALAVGVIPEALPLVMTFSFSRAALRMAKKHVVVKRLSAINDLGSIDVLCTDKTGTLTKHAMTVVDVHAPDPRVCIRYALLGSSYLTVSKKEEVENEFDKALWLYAGEEVQLILSRARMIEELPFDPERRKNSVLFEVGGRRELAVRGFPEGLIADRNHSTRKSGLEAYIKDQGFKGRRLLAIARKQDSFGNSLSLEDETDLEFLGLIAFEESLKEGTLFAVKRAAQLGVQVKILTGDAREVAGAVGHRLGLIDRPEDVITGKEFETLPLHKQIEEIRSRHVFSRVNPEQKLSIISLIEQQGHSVGFLGEGFNDAPALKKANVSLVVQEGSDVARDSADVILLRRTLTVIIDGIEEGRRSFANTIKYLRITLASNFGNFYAVAIASLLVPFLPMLPTQILLVNVLTDMPMILIAADTVVPSDLRKPNKYRAHDIIIAATVLGIISSIFDFITFVLFKNLGQAHLQTYWFIVSVLTELTLIYSLRTRNLFFRGARVPFSLAFLTLAAAGVAVILPRISFGQEIFGFVAPQAAPLAIASGIVVLYFISSEVAKGWFRKTG